MISGKRYFLFIPSFCLGCMLVVRAQQPELVLPVGHTDIVRTAGFSPDGKYIITGGLDKVANVWETFTGKKIHTLDGNKSSVTNAFFSDNGKYIAVGTDSSVNIWYTQTYTLIGNFDLVKKVLFTSDSKKLFLLKFDGLMEQFDLQTMKKEYEFQHYAIEPDLVLSPDGKQICSHTNGNVYIRDIATKKIVFEYRPDGNVKSLFYSVNGLYLDVITGTGIEKVNIKNKSVSKLSTEFIDFFYTSKNNRFLLAVSGFNFNESAVLWDLQKSKPIFRSDTVRSVGDTFAVYDKDYNMIIKTGNAPHNFPNHLSYRQIAISNDGQYIRASEMLWNTADYMLSYNMESSYLRKTGFSNDSRYILVQLKDGEISLWDIKGKKHVQGYKTIADNIKVADISSDGRKLATVAGRVAKIIDLATGFTLQLLDHPETVVSAQFGKDGKELLTNCNDSVARIWDTETGQLLQNFPHHHIEINPAYFEPSGELILSKPNYFSVPVYDLEGNPSRDTLIINANANLEKLRSSISSGARYRLIINDMDGTIRLIDSAHQYSERLGIDFYTSAFSDNEKLLAIAGNYPDTLLVRDIEARKWIFAGKVDSIFKSNTGRAHITQLLFTPDNKYLLAVDEYAVIHALSTRTYTTEFTIQGQQCRLSKDGKYLVVLNQGKCDVYDFEKRKHLYTYISVDPLNYLVVDPQKRFDGTEKARKMLYYSCGNELVDLEQAKDQLWVPDLAERIIKGDSINARTLNELNICGLTPQVEDAGNAPGSYHFKITPRRGGIGETVLSINGTPTKTYRPEQLSKKGSIYELTVKKEELNSYFIAGTENFVSIKSYTSDNSISSRGLKINEDRTGQVTVIPNFYAVMVGISDYKGDELDLKYAAKDAVDLSDAVANAARKLLNTDAKEHVFMYNLSTAKEHYQLPEKKSIKNILREIGAKATANDILFIFFAGHGVMETQKKQFYFLTADASKTLAADAVADVGISTAELTEWMRPQNIKAQKRILIFDACNSGQAISDFVKMGKDGQGYIAARSDDKAQQIKAIDKLNEKSGLFILSASASNQSAYEMGRYSQGLLTYSLLKAIKQQPDILEDGKYLNVSRWFNAAEKTVSDLAKESGARQEPQIVTNANFNIGIVDEEVMAKIILPMEKPLFTASNFQNADENIMADDLGLNKLIDKQLNEISSRGTDAGINYIGNSNLPDAYSLIGRYTVAGNNVSIRVIIRKNNVIKHRLELSGTKEKLDELSKSVAVNAADWAARNK